ncbi:MAG TPA: LLM class flavin-dependent oxidoreductase [Bradyrhizobium sp.]|jgi:alkanesulfonate monooxygenase SsuD/methylene tetrahydromethanopterin reductase-like flavin-dependent oxidoreductase (luciferase family)
MQDVSFGFQAAASDVAGVPDAQLYRDLMADCELGHRLGYDAAWLLEHHFSDYYPTPSPLLMMAHIAAKFPDLSLGTSVLVLPWYHPLRLAEEIAMLNMLTRGTLHLGIGRGTARMEYNAYNIDMNEGRARFAEVFEIVEQGLKGQPFSYRGKFWNIEQPIQIRPEPSDKPVRFYGAIGSPASAEVMGDLGIPPICLSTFPDGLLVKILDRWDARVGVRGNGATLPISVKMFIADTDEEAREMGRRYYPPYFALQADHYEADANPWSNIPEYADFSRMFANLRKLTDPAELGPFLDSNLVGSPETICRRIETLIGLGFNYFMVSSATPGTPRAVRQHMMTRFAEEICPRYSGAMRKGRAA